MGAKSATIAAKVSGYVTSVDIEDNAHVKEGDTIARIDDGDYQLAVRTAKDQIATQQATIARIGKQIASQLAAVDQAKAQLNSAKAGETRAVLELQASRRSPPRASPASRRWSRHKPLATRPPPRARPRKPAWMPP